jgi:Ca-activated chloride channel family protein
VSLFRNPEAFWILLVLPILAWRHWRNLFVDGANVSHPAGFALSSGGTVWFHLHFLLKVAAIVLLVVGLARPQKALAGEETTTEGVDIMVVLDTSGSMDARDFKPRNRLGVAKQVVRDFVEGRVADRIGLVVFAARAVTRCPLTVDYDVLLQLVQATELGVLPDGTAIGNALATAVSRLKASKAKSRVIVLVTDGVNNTGEIDPQTAAEMAQTLGFKVYAVGVGREGTAPFPVTNPYTGRKELVEMEVRIDEELLTDIAQRTGGRYFRATDSETLRSIFKQIDTLERSTVHIQRWMDYVELYPAYVFAGLTLLAFWTVLGQTVLRRLP